MMDEGGLLRLQHTHMSNQFWDLVHWFFAAARKFDEIYQTYESKVLAYADERSLDRRLLRLSGEEVAGLLDFKRLDAICNTELQILKTIAHNIYRSPVSTDPVDRYVSQVYHEMSILKEEQYKIGTIAPAYQTADSAAYESIVAEVHEAFPRHVHAMHDLFQKARLRLEELYPHYRRDRVMLRSVYLYGDDVFDGFYPNGYEDVLERMFPDGGVRRGLLEVAKSFHRAGFLENALEAVERARRLPAPDGPPERVALAASVDLQIDELYARIKAKQAEKTKRRTPA